MFKKNNIFVSMFCVVVFSVVSGCSVFYERPVLNPIVGTQCPNKRPSENTIFIDDSDDKWVLTKEEKKTEPESKQEYTKCIYSAVKYDNNSIGNLYAVVEPYNSLYVVGSWGTFNYGELASKLMNEAKEKEKEAYYASPAGKEEIVREEEKRNKELKSAEAICKKTSLDVERKYDVGAFSRLVNCGYSGNNIYMCVSVYTKPTPYGGFIQTPIGMVVNSQTGVYEIKLE